MEKLSLKDRLNEKINDLKEYLNFLSLNFPKEFNDYKKDNIIKAVCERYFEKIVEAMIDIGFLIIKVKKIRIPFLDESVFSVLAEEKIINDNLAKNLVEAKSMRNFIIHQYGGIDDQKIFIVIKGELIPDTKRFLKEIKNKKI